MFIRLIFKDVPFFWYTSFVDINEFKQKRIESRKQLLKKIVENFKLLNPIAIHQFGSGGMGFKDEFSDIDIWITFKDDEISFVLRILNKIFRDISPVLIRHYSKSWSPVGGSANSIIHDTEFGPIVVDYYISKHSETVIKEDSVVLYGDDSLKRGVWRLNKEVNKDIHDSHTFKKDVNLLIDLIFISIKGIVRKWDNDDFINNLKRVHKLFRERYDKNMKRRHINLSFKSYLKILSDLYKVSNKGQKRAINKIRKYIKQVNLLYA